MRILEISRTDFLMKNSEKIKKMIKENGFIILRGLFNPSVIRQVLPKLRIKFEKSKVLGTTKGTYETVRKNSIKWSIGCNSGAQKEISRLMLVSYNPIIESDIYDFRKNFIKLIQIRDNIRNDKKSTFDENLFDGNFNACRFLTYPKGGGFMSMHNDYVAVKNSKNNGAEMLQLILCITSKNDGDFQEGGAYIIHDKKKINIEDHINSGDVLVYNGQIMHGVDDVDPFMPFDTQKIEGRVVALVTIYN